MATATYTPAQLSSAAKWAWGQCTYYAGLFWRIPWAGDAWQWAAENQWPKSGYASSAPAQARVGDIVVFQPGVAGADKDTGHVALVTGIDPGGASIDVAEMNWGGVLNQVHTRTGVPIEAGETFIEPPQSAAVATPPTTNAQLAGFGLPNVNPFDPNSIPGHIIGGATQIPGAIAGIPGDIGSGIASGIGAVFQALAKPLENVVIRLMLAAFGAVLVIVALHILAGSAEREAEGGATASQAPVRRGAIATAEEEAPEAAAAA